MRCMSTNKLKCNSDKIKVLLVEPGNRFVPELSWVAFSSKHTSTVLLDPSLLLEQLLDSR